MQVMMNMAWSSPELKSLTTLRPIQPGNGSLADGHPILLHVAHVHAHALTLPDPEFSTPVAEPPQALSVVDARSFLLRFCFLHVNPQLTQEMIQIEQTRCRMNTALAFTNLLQAE